MNNTQSNHDLTVDIRPGDGFPEWIKSDSDYNRYVSEQVAKQQEWLDKVVRNPEMIEGVDPLDNPMGSLFSQESDQSDCEIALLTRTLCLPVSWYSYIVNGNGCYFQVDCELIESTLKDYGYTVKDFVESTENPFLYEFNGCMASCLEYTFMVNTQESDRFI